MDHKKKCLLCKEIFPIGCFSLFKEYGSTERSALCFNCEMRIDGDKESDLIDDNIDDNGKYLEKLSSAMLELSRHDINRLNDISREEFAHKTNSHEELSNVSFGEIKNIAKEKLVNMGYNRPSGVTFNKGRYLVLGDSHGKHTKRKMFELLGNLNDNLNFDQIIHVGHILDDDNMISCCWDDFDNLTIISKLEESHRIEEYLLDGFNFNVVRDYLYIGNLKIMNQDLITDYVKTFIGSIDPLIFSDSTIVNSHRHEFDVRCGDYNVRDIIASPGSLCEKHIVKTIKQIDFVSGYQVKEAKTDSFKKYRRMKHMSELWEQGFFIVEVDYNGDYSISPCRIQKIGNDYATSYFDKIYIGNKVVDPTRKIFINSDLHCDNHNRNLLEIQNNFCQDYNPDIYVNLGDSQNNKSLNYHEIGRGFHIDKSIVDECASLDFILKKMSKWADEKYYLYGNHERFAEDFYRKYPQLKDLFQYLLLSPLEKYGYHLIEHKDVLKLGGVNFIHGDMKMYGSGGSLKDKVAKVFKGFNVIGHLHTSMIRFGTYIVPMTGNLDQEYNEVHSSKWVGGFSICNQYEGVSFISNFMVLGNKVLINGKLYYSRVDDFWKSHKRKMEINYLK